MGRNDKKQTTDAELDVLNVLWEKGPSTVRDVHDTLTRSRDIRYTTTLKTLQVMTTKWLVERDESRKAHVYVPAVGREETQRSLVGDLVEKAFAGSAAGLMAGALSAKRASAEELAEMRRLLDEAEQTVRES